MLKAPPPVNQTNRFTATVRKLLSLKGEAGGPAFEVSLEDERPEFSFLKSERRFAQFQSVTSAAGTLAFIGVRNMPNSGVIVVVDSIFAAVEAAGVRVELVAGANSSGASPVAMFSTDGRWGPGFAGATTALTFAAAAAAAPGGHVYSQLVSLAANDVMDFVAGRFGPRVGAFVLPPGTQVQLDVVGVGVHTLEATFGGYERPLESGELL